MANRGFSLVLALALVANAFSAPLDVQRWRRGDNEVDSKDGLGKSMTSSSTTDPFDDDDEDFGDSSTSAPSGSNLFSLLRLAGALLPNLSSSNQNNIMSNAMIQKVIRELMKLDKKNVIQPRKDILSDNEIEIDDIIDLKPPFQRQEIEESEDSSESTESDDSGDDDDDESDENNGAEVDSSENGDKGSDDDGDKDNDGNDKQDSDSNEDSDSDEPPESDGEGGGILGLLAGLSGGDGQSDLGSLLAAVSGIVGNLSGDGVDVNALIASGFGLFVGLLSQGEENAGSILASYLLTSLESLTGGGANNNGAFFGNFISKLVKGTSAAEVEEGSSEEEGNKTPMADSAGFFGSLIMSLLGDMSKTSSSSHPWRRGDNSWLIFT